MGRYLKQRGYYLWVTFSMLLCAAVFFPWFYPRETVSGLLGRWQVVETGRRHRFANQIAPVIDYLFHAPFGLESCIDTHALEQAAREALYVRGELN
jgi:hypothetical protein